MVDLASYILHLTSYTLHLTSYIVHRTPHTLQAAQPGRVPRDLPSAEQPAKGVEVPLVRLEAAQQNDVP